MKKSLNHLVPSYAKHIVNTNNPVFRTCEVLIRIDNLFQGEGNRPLGSRDKIRILRALRKHLELSFRTAMNITNWQDDLDKSVFELLDRRIDHYKVVEAKTPPPPRVYDRRPVWG